MKEHILCFIISGILFTSCVNEDKNHAVEESSDTGKSEFYIPARVLTSAPGYHWFGYYDKLQFDPTGRYVLCMQTPFENRSPNADDVIKVGMIDTEDNDKWIELGESSAWNWQQGCMLQFIPGSDTKVIWNDRKEGKFISHICDIKTFDTRILPFPVYTISPDGQTALSVDFERINDLRPGYGYAGIEDPNKHVIAPDNAGIYHVNLLTGEKKLIITISKMNYRPLHESSDTVFKDLKSGKNWFNHLLFNTDGSRFVFLHRWISPSKGNVGGFGTIMYSSDTEGKDIRMVDGSGYSSHFIWRDSEHILVWTKYMGQNDGFYLFKDDGSGLAENIGEGIMSSNGHCMYLPGNEWILNDTYPDKDRLQHVYLYHIKSKKRIPVADMHLPVEYRGEWRVDTHPRFSPDGNRITLDGVYGDNGRQLFLLEISEIITDFK